VQFKIVTEEQRYAEAWYRLRLVRWILALVFLTYLPGMATLALRFPSVPGAYFFFGWAAVLLVATVTLATLRCPRCGKSFASSLTWNNPFTSKCLHCGIRAGSHPNLN